MTSPSEIAELAGWTSSPPVHHAPRWLSRQPNACRCARSSHSVWARHTAARRARQHAPDHADDRPFSTQPGGARTSRPPAGLPGGQDALDHGHALGFEGLVTDAVGPDRRVHCLADAFPVPSRIGSWIGAITLDERLFA